MSREIKFRGQKIDSDDWVYGYYHKLIASGTHCIDVPMPDYDQSTLWHVKPETVGQYTGLKDKNEVGVHEGDMLRCGNNETASYEVFYHDGEGAFKLRPHFRNPQCGGWIPHIACRDLEVIGNIHTNPELLEGRS